MYDLKRISEEIEALGGMSAEDVLHVGKAIVRNMREKLTDGNSVRLDDFGNFPHFVSLHSNGKSQGLYGEEY